MEGGSQAQDHGQAIYAKIRYSVSSTLVVLVGLLVVVYNQTEKTRKQVTSTKSPGKRKAVNVVNHFSRATVRQVAEDNFP